jgi:pyrophosphatase PpaX
MAFRALGFPELFDAVVTAGDTGAHKPSGEPVLLALERLGASPDRAIYIGDSPVDIAAGKAAGVATAGVLWGIFSEQALRDAAPDFVFATIDEMVGACLGDGTRGGRGRA